MSISRKNFVIAAIAALIPAKAAAQVQTVGNSGQIVSTGNVWVDQDAAGNQTVYDAQGNIIATQAVGSGLQIVSTGDVHAGQRASGSQTVVNTGWGDVNNCTPGTYGFTRDGCLEFCNCDGEVQRFCCQTKARCRGKC